MKNNKSIDGLVTRDAKKPASPRKATPKTTTSSPSKIIKPVKTTIKKPTTTAKKIAIKNTPEPIASSTITTDQINDNPIEIEVFSDDTQSLTPTPKPVKKSKTSTTKTHEQIIEDFLAPIEAFNFDDKPASESSEDNTKVPMKDLKHPILQEKSDSDTTAKATKVKKPKKKLSKPRKIILIIVSTIVLLIIGFIIWALIWGNDIIGKITGGQGNIFDLFSLMDENYEPLKTDENGRTNILAFGTSGYDMSGEEGGGVHDGAQLTDSIMLISLDQETGDIAMLSLPRDLKASPTCTATGKINEVYWCNNMNGDNEEAGATALMSEVGTILGVDIQYYAHLNWGSLVSIVDILGGIKVTLDEDINDYYYTGAVYQAGIEYELNGLDAVALARARHGTNGGDFSRGASQQKILIGIKDKIFEKDLSLTDILGLASTLGDNLRTNLSVEELKTSAHLFSNFDFDTVRELSLYPDYMTTGTINGISYVLPKGGTGNYRTIQNYVEKMLSNDPRKYENPSIIILNASGTPGVASAERTILEEDGYIITDIDDAPAGEYQEGYTIYATTDKPGTADLIETHYNTELLPIEDSPIQGYDFVIITNPASAEE